MVGGIFIFLIYGEKQIAFETDFSLVFSSALCVLK
jgi:hypothetical protein